MAAHIKHTRRQVMATADARNALLARKTEERQAASAARERYIRELLRVTESRSKIGVGGFPRTQEIPGELLKYYLTPFPDGTFPSILDLVQRHLAPTPEPEPQPEPEPEPEPVAIPELEPTPVATEVASPEVKTEEDDTPMDESDEPVVTDGDDDVEMQAPPVVPPSLPPPEPTPVQESNDPPQDARIPTASELKGMMFPEGEEPEETVNPALITAPPNPPQTPTTINPTLTLSTPTSRQTPASTPLRTPTTSTAPARLTSHIKPLTNAYTASLPPLPPLPPDIAKKVAGVKVRRRGMQNTGSGVNWGENGIWKGAQSPGAAVGGLGPGGAGAQGWWASLSVGQVPQAGTSNAPQPGMELLRWQAILQINPAHVFARRPTKCVTTHEWRVLRRELEYTRAIQRIESLKQDGMWSFRQPKKQRGPVMPKTHWDYLMDEMKWLQVDFREERRWKTALAFEIVHAVKDWHDASPEERKAMRVGFRRVVEVDTEAEDMEMGETDKGGDVEMQGVGDDGKANEVRSEPDDDGEGEQEPEPEPEKPHTEGLAPREDVMGADEPTLEVPAAVEEEKRNEDEEPGTLSKDWAGDADAEGEVEDVLAMEGVEDSKGTLEGSPDKDLLDGEIEDPVQGALRTDATGDMTLVPSDDPTALKEKEEYLNAVQSELLEFSQISRKTDCEPKTDAFGPAQESTQSNLPNTQAPLVAAMASGSEPQRDVPLPADSSPPIRRVRPYPSNRSNPSRKTSTRGDSTFAPATSSLRIPTMEAISNIPPRLKATMTTLKGALKDLKPTLHALPPVQSAVGGLEECLACMQIREKPHQSYENLMSDLTELAHLLQAEFAKSSPQSVPHSIANIAWSIDEQTNAIKNCQDPSQVGQLASAKDDDRAIIECYKRIIGLFEHLQASNNKGSVMADLITPLQADVSLSIWDDIQDQRMDTYLERLMPAHEAYHNAALPTSMTKRVACTENTRVDLLGSTWTWARQHDGPRIYWLNGMAGTGKTTIAYTMCKMLQETKQLGASFFCSRNSPYCGNVNKIVPTIAYQLGRYSNPYRRVLCNVLKEDPDVARRDISTQFEHLVSQPLSQINKAMPDNVIVVIDALDECIDADGTRDVLDMLLRHAGNLPIKFFVASRPESAISDRMTAGYGAMRSILWLHDIDKSLVQADIKTYLANALQGVQVTPSELNALADKAGCLFIFAATAVRYIVHRKGSINHRQRLQAVLNLHPAQENKCYTDIDKLYGTILSNALDTSIFEEGELAQRRQVLWTVACAREPLTTSALAELLNMSDIQEVEAAVQPLLSVLHVSEITNVVSTLHASFSDFLLDTRRAQQFHCDETGQNAYLAECCFQLMNRSLRFNICGLETSHVLDQDVPNLKDRVDKSISTAVFYSCRYWGDHLIKGPPLPPLEFLLKAFLQRHFLFWMEVLNLKRVIGHGEAVLAQVLGWISTETSSTDIQDFIYDARNFLITYACHPISLSTPHIYISALPFVSEKSHVWAAYWPQTQGLIRIKSKAVEVKWKSTLITWAVGDSIHSAAQSSDGKLVVFGSQRGLFGGGEVNIWDTSSSTCIIGPLKAHKEWISAVAYSPDNNRIASGSADSKICIWDASDGRLIAGPLHGHTDYINGLSFSSDGTSLMSSSPDRDVRLWDAYSGTPLGEPLKGHQGNMKSVAFSPDGMHLASSSDDHSIRVLDLSTRTVAQRAFSGHTGAVCSIVYSPNALRLASGSEDCTVHIWDVTQGTSLAGAFRGHTGTVSSVAFSPNASLVVSGSRDRTVRVWDVVSGMLLAEPFRGHGDRVNTVLFTANGRRILSGSYDGTICVWDAIRGPNVCQEIADATESLQHARVIRSVALSPDGMHAASGSDDCTICVWNTHDGSPTGGLFEGHTGEVNSLAFSPDGARIVSGSDDCTPRVWDTSTGADLLGGPLEGQSARATSVAFSPDGNLVASSSHDSTIWIWHSHTGQLITMSSNGYTNLVPPIVHSPGCVFSVVPYSVPDLHILDSPGVCEIQTWNDSGTPPFWASHAAGPGYVHCVTFSPDGSRVVAGSWDYTSLPLDARNGVVLHTPFSGHTHWVLSVALSPDATHVASGSWDRTVRVWNTQSGMMVAGPFEGHTDEVTSVGFSPDGGRVISSSADGSIRLWDFATATHSDATFYRDLSMNDAGWLTNSKSQLLLWVPPDLRKDFELPSPPNVAIINSESSSFIDNSSLYLGDQWHNCYGLPVPFAV